MASAAAGSWSKRWIRPEVWPLFFATGTAVGICGMQLIRNITGNPEVRSGPLDSFSLLPLARLLGPIRPRVVRFHPRAAALRMNERT